MRRWLVPGAVMAVVAAVLTLTIARGALPGPQVAAEADPTPALPTGDGPRPSASSAPSALSAPVGPGPTPATPTVPEPVAPAPTPPRVWKVDAPAPVARPVTVKPGPPSIQLPTLGVTARLAAAEVVAGEYAVPHDPLVVGAYRPRLRGLEKRLEPAPGVLLMSGHVTLGEARGALWPLHGLAPGDPIVTSGPGGVRRWYAKRLDVHRADQLPADLLRADGPETLVLVTCSGPVVTADGRRAYRDNLVVTAVPA